MRRSVLSLVHLLWVLAGCGDEAQSPPDWAQWGKDAAHAGAVEVSGQSPERILDELVHDPFVGMERAETFGAVLIHYPAPLLAGDQVVMSVKSGRYVSCNPPGSGQPFPCGIDARDLQTWSVRSLRWRGRRLAREWQFDSDWKPEPNGRSLNRWEPVFHAVLSGDSVYVPGRGGSIFKLRRRDGRMLERIDPFGLDAGTFVAGPLSTDPQGNVYYNALKLQLGQDPAGSDPWDRDAAGGWLVKVSPDGQARTADFSSLIPGAPGAADLCEGSFSNAQLPWPPSPEAVPPASPCGSQRPSVNVAPAIAPDGTVYTLSRAHFNARYGYLVAVDPELRPKWNASLRGRLDDGCGRGRMPPNGAPGGCREGARPGVDPATNAPPAGLVSDQTSASPTIAPDGSILYGAFTRYNHSRGHLFKFSPQGQFLAAYDFGWDTTPAIYAHDGTWSAVIKENLYEVGSYCNVQAFCPPGEGLYRITQLSAELSPEWSYTHTNTESCVRRADGSLACTSDHPDGFEWCINAPAVDGRGVVYANSEDGNLYAIGQGGRELGHLFLQLAVGAAYTPLSIGQAGRIYTQNFGSLFAVGE